MIWVSIIGSLIFTALWLAGGQFKGRIRDIGCPITLALVIALKTQIWWHFLVMGAYWQVIRLGYGNYDPENDPKPSFLAKITHDRNGWWIRAIYGFLVALVGGGWLLWTEPIKYSTYILGNALIGFLVSRLKLNVILTDTCVSLGFCSLMFLV